MTEGLEVTVRVVTSDKNGTLIGDVLLPDGRALNFLVIEEGLAWWDRSPHSDYKLSEIEELAQASRRGLWEDPYPIPPWEWRKGRRNPEP
jgi:endonuclease YncB( thermonuclease family)